MSDDSHKLMVKQMDGNQLSFVFDSETQSPAPESTNLVSFAHAEPCLMRPDLRAKAVSSAKVLQFLPPGTSITPSRTSTLVDRIVNSIRLYN